MNWGSAEIQERYDSIMRHLVKEPLHPKLRAVHLREKPNGVLGVGTLVLPHNQILTASHHFHPNHGKKLLYYQMLQPYDTIAYPINAAHEVEGLGLDVAVCTPGPLQEIGEFSSYEDSLAGAFQSQAWVGRDLSQCTHLLTGATVTVFGWAALKNSGSLYRILDYQSSPAESGTGFLKSNQLLILRGGIRMTDEARTQLAIPGTTEEVTLAAEVNFE